VDTLLCRAGRYSAPLADGLRAVTEDRSEPGYPADKARQGEIILNRRWQRIVFIAGLVGILVLAVVS